MQWLAGGQTQGSANGTCLKYVKYYSFEFNVQVNLEFSIANEANERQFIYVNSHNPCCDLL